MDKEQYVTSKVAKLLREKGFRGDCIAYYNDDGKRYLSLNAELHPLPCPTQAVACRWLKEVHKIDISVTPDDGSWWIKVTELESWSSVFNGKVLNSDDIKYAYKGDTSTKEECYEAGLWYVLKNLI